MLRCFRNIFLLLAGLFLYGSGVAQGEGDSKVFFLGIGIEKCLNGTPGKPNAVADVQLVMNRTKKDAQSGDVNFTQNGSSLMVSKAACYTLFNDQATVRNIDSVVNLIKLAARPQDVFYLYISAQSTGLNGSFTVPAEPNPKKGKPVTPQRVILESSHLKDLCGSVQCQSQILVADAVTWQENHDVLLMALLAPAAEGKNQIIVAPFSESSDSFLVANKYVSAFAGSIYNAGQSLLRLLVKNSTVTDKVKTSMNNAYNALTGSDDMVAAVYESWKLVEGGVGAGAIVKTAQPEPARVTTQPQPVKPNLGRGFEEDQPAPVSSQYSLKDTKHFALIVANWQYNDPDWQDLNNPLNDALALKTELETYYGFEVRLCTNLTKESMEGEIIALHKRNLGPNSQVLFYFAGHGGYQQLGANSGTGYLVPVDGKSQRVDSTMSSYYSYDVLKARLLTLPSQHVLSMIDACYSGSADPSVFNKNDGGTKDDIAQAGTEVKRGTVTAQMNECMLKKSRYFICSGKLEEVKDGVKGGLSPFAKVITDRLALMRKRDLNDQEIVFGMELEIALSKTKEINSYAFSFGSNNESACSFMFVPPAHRIK